MLVAPLSIVMGQGTGFETFLGENLLGWLTLAIGGALAVGTLLALVRPPARQVDGNGPVGNGPVGNAADRSAADRSAADRALARPPLGRSLVMIAVGLVAAIWGLASLLSG